MLSLLHEKAKPVFSLFLSEIQAMGFNVHINGVIYTVQKGIELNKENPKNPIWSYHTFGFAVDLNPINIDTKRCYMKVDSKNVWEETKIPQVARNLGLFWGGDYHTYHDPIHFEFRLLPFQQLRKLGKEQFNDDPEAEYNKIIIPESAFSN
jgi:hypothetical protein